MPWVHGGAGTREYRQWKHAKSRCYNPNNPKYYRYGGRGIGMYDGWRDDFARFRADMGDCPLRYTLDRINNDGNYEPGNCRWATPRQQSNNTRRNIWVTFNERTQTIAQWARELGYPAKALSLRLGRHGWSTEQALTLPIRPNRNWHTRTLTLNGETHTIPEWAALRGWRVGALKARIRSDWPVEVALTKKMEAPRGKRHG